MASSGNFCTLNPLGAQGGGTIDIGTLSNGNLSVSLTDTAFGNFGVTSGKWYWEFRMVSSATSGTCGGWANQQTNSQPELGYNSPASATGVQMVYMYFASSPMSIVSDGPKSNTYGGNADVNTIVQNDIIGIAADFDNDKWYFSINGSFDDMRSGQNPSTGSSPMCSASGGGGLQTIARTAGYTWFPAIGNWAAPTRDYTVNFGQDDTFGGAITAAGNADDNGFGVFKYAPPTGFLAMCSGNLSVSDDIDPAQTDTDYPSKQFNAITYTGNGSTNAITGLGFKPDLVWVKRRNSSGDHRLVDSTRGAGIALRSNVAAAEVSESNGVTAFGTDGFTLGSEGGYNASSDTFIAWCWRVGGGSTSSNSEGDITSTVQANTKAGFSIVKWTSNNQSNQDIGHGLSAAPRFIISKPYSASTWSWHVFHHYLGSIGNFQLNNGNAFSSGANTYGAMPTSSVFRVGTPGNLMPNNTGTDCISYCWHDVEGMQRFSIYTGNGNADGPFIYTGFRPRLLVVKKGSGSNDWVVSDTARNTHNPASKVLRWEDGAAETSSNREVDILSNGFKIRTSNDVYNGSGGTYAYMCWGDVPFKYDNTF